MNVIERSQREIMQLKIDIPTSSKHYEKFVAIKRELGIKSNAEVFRYILTHFEVPKEESNAR